MVKVRFKYHTGYCGSDNSETIEYPDDVTDAELSEDAWQGALQNAESYGYEPWPDDMSEDELETVDTSRFSDNIEGSFTRLA